MSCGSTADPFALVGYVDEPEYQPGSRVEVKVSSTMSGTARLVRLRHGDTDAAGPGSLIDTVPGAQRPFSAGVQHLLPGSWGVSSGVVGAPSTTAATLSVWLWPTRYADSSTVIAIDDGATAVAVVLDGDGRVGVAVRTGPAEAVVFSEVFLRLRR